MYAFKRKSIDTFALQATFGAVAVTYVAFRHLFILEINNCHSFVIGLIDTFYGKLLRWWVSKKYVYK